MAKKFDNTEIDEAELLHEMSVYGQEVAKGNYAVKPSPPEEETEEIPQPEIRKRKSKSNQSYEERFLLSVDPASRNGKSITLRREYYDKLSLLLKALRSEMTLIGFVDNILTHHFEMYREEMDQLFRQHAENLFKKE